MATARKALTAALATFAAALGTAMLAGDLDATVTLAAVGAGLLAGAGVYRVPNAPGREV